MFKAVAPSALASAQGVRAEHLHVIVALKGAGIGPRSVTHAAAHLLHRSVLVLGRPVGEVVQDATRVPDTVLNQRRSHHRNLRPGHHALYNILGTVDAACDCQTWPYGTVENRNPVQAQGELARVT